MGLSSTQFVWLVIVVIGGFIIFAAIVYEYLMAKNKATIKLEQTREKEQTKREIAAYVAEGSISPDDAARLLAADPGEGGKLASRIKEALSGLGDCKPRPVRAPEPAEEPLSV